MESIQFKEIYRYFCKHVEDTAFIKGQDFFDQLDHLHEHMTKEGRYDCELMFMLSVFRDNELNKKELDSLANGFFPIFDHFIDKIQQSIEMQNASQDQLTYIFMKINLLLFVIRRFANNSTFKQKDIDSLYKLLEAMFLSAILYYKPPYGPQVNSKNKHDRQ